MTKMLSQLKTDKYYWLTLLVGGVLFYLLNLFTTLKGDDMLYAYVVGTDFEPLDTLSRLFRSQANHYMEDNGRSANFIAQLFCGLLGKGVFNVLNAVMAMALIHNVALWVDRRRRSVMVAALTLLFLLTFAPYPGDTMLWLTGSTNYLWAVTFTLMLLNWLRHREHHRETALTHVLVAIAALVSGAMNETVTVPTLCALVICYFTDRDSRTAIMRTAIIAYAAGVAVIVCSPGAWARFGTEYVDRANDQSLMAQLAVRAKFVAKAVVLYVTPVFALLVMAGTIVKRGFRAVVTDVMVWMWLFAALLLYAVGDGQKERIYFFWAVVSLIIVLQPLCRLETWRQTLARVVAVVALVGCVYPAYKAIVAVRAQHELRAKLDADIAAAPKQCVLPALPHIGNRWVSKEIYDSEAFNGYESLYRSYFDKDNVVFLRDSLMTRYTGADLLAGAQVAPFTSSRPDLAGTVYYFPQQSFSLVPVNAENIDLSQLSYVLYVTDLDHRKAHPDEYFVKGNVRSRNLLPLYHLTGDGQCYLVVAAAERGIYEYEIPLLDSDGSPVTVTIERNAE